MISALEEFELSQSSSALTVNGTVSKYAPSTNLGQRWRVYAGLVGMLIVAVTFIVLFMPEKISGFVTGEDPNRPTLAEQALEDPDKNAGLPNAEAATACGPRNKSN